ncbi:DNA polymerase subunit Cdc27 [Melanogaster broomeanus]|nr:DNA polymerase subunit Cdc27 [Melanogaster broomeanus]
MTTTQARNFLAKELFIKRSVVTFRSLSRALGIHVNEAKNELKTYYETTRDTDSPAVPTYFVSGEHGLGFEEDGEEPDVVYESKVMLVDAKLLEETVSQFSHVHSVHIYSLSPSRLVDAGLLCAANISVRNADVKNGAESFPIVGKIAGAHVKMKAGASISSAASSSKMTLDAPAKSAPKAGPLTKAEQPPKGTDIKEQISAKASLPETESKDRPKPSGKLDWSKAKSKEKQPVLEKAKEPKVEPKRTGTSKESATSEKTSSGSKRVFVSKLNSNATTDSEAQQRGTKRKSRSLSDSESEPSSTQIKPAVVSRSSNVASISDDEEGSDSWVPGRRRQKGKNNATPDSEMSLRAMMDIDDERVSRVSKVRPEREEEEESEAAEETMAHPGTSEAEVSDDEPILPQKKRKPRKVVPVGRNGLKKRRVIKSRTTTDAKGYMQTEDYSSYESVEEEKEEAAHLKQKGKKKVVEPKAEEIKPKAKEKAAPKPRGAAPKRGGLLNFFGSDTKGKK